jgi:hypothetical protein
VKLLNSSLVVSVGLINSRDHPDSKNFPPLPEKRHRFFYNWSFVRGPGGCLYYVNIRNLSNRPVYCVVSIDGMSVFTQQAASRNDSDGLYFDPEDALQEDAIQLDRFLIDPSTPFTFTYTTEPGKEKHVGGIGVIFYHIDPQGIPVTGYYKRVNDWRSIELRRSPDPAALAFIYYHNPLEHTDPLKLATAEHFHLSSIPPILFPGDSSQFPSR